MLVFSVVTVTVALTLNLIQTPVILEVDLGVDLDPKVDLDPDQILGLGAIQMTRRSRADQHQRKHPKQTTKWS